MHINIHTRMDMLDGITLDMVTFIHAYIHTLFYTHQHA